MPYDHTIEPGHSACRPDGSVFEVKSVYHSDGDTSVYAVDSGFVGWLGKEAWPCPEKPTQERLDAWNKDLSGECRPPKKGEWFVDDQGGLHQWPHDSNVWELPRHGRNRWILVERAAGPKRECQTCKHFDDRRRPCGTCYSDLDHNEWQPKTLEPVKIGPNNWPRGARVRDNTWPHSHWFEINASVSSNIAYCSDSHNRTWPSLTAGGCSWNLRGMAPDDWLPVGVFPRESGE